MKAQSSLAGTVVASDAFFPFPDGVEEAAKSGSHGGDPAWRIGARSRRHRRGGPSGPSHGFHWYAPLPALRNKEMVQWVGLTCRPTGLLPIVPAEPQSSARNRAPFVPGTKTCNRISSQVPFSRCVRSSLRAPATSDSIVPAPTRDAAACSGGVGSKGCLECRPPAHASLQKRRGERVTCAR